jgi:hypothetical protein
MAIAHVNLWLMPKYKKKYLVAIYFNSQSGKENKFSNFSKIIIGFSKGFHNKCYDKNQL